MHAVPRGTPEGPGIPLGVAEGLDTEKVKASTVRVVYGEGDSPMISSGFFVAADKIATCIHVVAEADLASLYVRTDNADYTIRGVTAFDTQNDLVILQVSSGGTPLVLGNSDAVRKGETVFSVGYVGYPVDRFNIMENTVLPGRLNGMWLRITPTTLPGNSGGPVLNTDEEVVGINVAGSGPIGYAIGSNVLEELLKQPGPIEPLAQWQQRDPIRSYTYLAQASNEFHDADYAGAIDAIDKIIALNPTATGMDMRYSNRGLAGTLLGHSKFDKDAPEVAQQYYRAAIQDLDKAISLNPEDVTAYVNRGYAKTLFGHSEFITDRTAEAHQYYRAAIKDYDEAINAEPGFPAYTERGTVKVALGLSETRQGRTTEAEQYYYAAISDFDMATSLNRHDTYAYIIRGYTRICLGDFEASRGNIEKARKQYKAAITDSDSAIKSDAKTVYGYHTRAVANAALDDYGSAIEDFDKTINFKPDFARAYYNRALVKVFLQEKGEAKADFKKAKELGLGVRK